MLLHGDPSHIVNKDRITTEHYRGNIPFDLPLNTIIEDEINSRSVE